MLAIYPVYYYTPIVQQFHKVKCRKLPGFTSDWFQWPGHYCGGRNLVIGLLWSHCRLDTMENFQSLCVGCPVVVWYDAWPANWMFIGREELQGGRTETEDLQTAKSIAKKDKQGSKPVPIPEKFEVS